MQKKANPVRQPSSRQPATTPPKRKKQAMEETSRAGDSRDTKEVEMAESNAELLRAKHRLHALIRAPIGTRRQILHDLMKAAPNDANQNGWEKDLKQYEKARIAEIEKLIDRASRAADLKTLTNIFRELTESTWRIQRAAKQRVIVDKHLLLLTGKICRVRLKKLKEPLQAAEKAQDIDKIKSMLKVYEQLEDVVGLREGLIVAEKTKNKKEIQQCLDTWKKMGRVKLLDSLGVDAYTK